MAQSNEDLTLAVCDLYEKTLLQLTMMLEVGPSVMALVQTMQERDPEFSAAYARHYEVAKNMPPFHTLPPLIEILVQAVQKIKAGAMN